MKESVPVEKDFRPARQSSEKDAKEIPSDEREEKYANLIWGVFIALTLVGVYFLLIIMNKEEEELREHMGDYVYPHVTDFWIVPFQVIFLIVRIYIIYIF